jgi:hypothetical protein
MMLPFPARPHTPPAHPAQPERGGRAPADRGGDHGAADRGAVRGAAHLLHHLLLDGPVHDRQQGGGPGGGMFQGAAARTPWHPAASRAMAFSPDLPLAVSTDARRHVTHALPPTPHLRLRPPQDKALAAAVKEQQDIMARHGEGLDMDVLGEAPRGGGGGGSGGGRAARRLGASSGGGGCQAAARGRRPRGQQAGSGAPTTPAA